MVFHYNTHHKPHNKTIQQQSCIQQQLYIQQQSHILDVLPRSAPKSCFTVINVFLILSKMCVQPHLGVGVGVGVWVWVWVWVCMCRVHIYHHAHESCAYYMEKTLNTLNTHSLSHSLTYLVVAACQCCSFHHQVVSHIKGCTWSQPHT